MIEGVISKQDVINLIDEYGYVNCHDGRDFEANNRVDRVRQKILELPDAFDLESMIKQLEEQALEHAITGQQYGEDGYSIHEIQEQGIKEGIEIAIGILKSATNGKNGGF